MIGLIGLQIGLWGGWGGHTSMNDLVAPNEQWHRFYGWGGGGVRFLSKRKIQPLLWVEAGRLISQERIQRALTRTHWSAVGVGLRLRPLSKVVSPILEGCAFRLNARLYSHQGSGNLGKAATLSANGVGWGAGISWQFHPQIELAILYQRRRPFTNRLEGRPGPARDRIEGFIGQLAVILPSFEASTPSRYQ